jgi:hypothetical protein
MKPNITIYILVLFFSLSKYSYSDTKHEIFADQISDSEIQDSDVYSAKYNFNGQTYELNVLGRDLNGSKKWKTGDEFPINIGKIRVEAEAEFRKTFPQIHQFKIMSINLIHLTIVDDWIISVDFNTTDFSNATPGPVSSNSIDILVLLNGRIIVPK